MVAVASTCSSRYWVDPLYGFLALVTVTCRDCCLSPYSFGVAAGRRRTLTVAAAPLKIFMSCSNAEKRIVFLTRRLDYRLREMDLTWNREQKLYTVIDAASCISWNASIIRQKLRGRQSSQRMREHGTKTDLAAPELLDQSAFELDFVIGRR